MIHRVAKGSEDRTEPKQLEEKRPPHLLGHIRTHGDDWPSCRQSFICWGKWFDRGAVLQRAIHSLEITIDTRWHAARVDFASIRHFFMT